MAERLEMRDKKSEILLEALRIHILLYQVCLSTMLSSDYAVPPAVCQHKAFLRSGIDGIVWLVSGDSSICSYVYVLHFGVPAQSQVNELAYVVGDS